MTKRSRKTGVLGAGLVLSLATPAFAQDDGRPPAPVRAGELSQPADQPQPLPADLIARQTPAEPPHEVAPSLGPSEPAPVTGDRIPVRRSFHPELQLSVSELQ